jgi:Ca2+-binding EF-hand superfamily protein
MKFIPSLLSALVLSTGVAMAADEAKPKAKVDPAEAFKKLDKDADGSISLEEFKAGQKDPAKAEEMFKKKDKDNDGKLSMEEFSARGKKK